MNKVNNQERVEKNLFVSLLRKMAAVFVLVFSRAMHLFFSFGGSCRFEPTCSQYGAIAIQKQGVFRGLRLLAIRLMSCHPMGGTGYAPVMDKSSVGGSRGI